MEDRATTNRQFRTRDVRSRLVLAAARLIGSGSKLWRQRALGTIFLQLNRVPLLRNTECTIEFERGCLFRLPVFEPYWGPTVVAGRPYEPEVVHLFRELRDLRPTFVDCGANWGFYSVLVTGPTFGYAGSVAIEANPTTFARLRENAHLNEERFVCLPFAIGARSGDRVVLASTEHHAVAHVHAPTSGSPARGDLVGVETITLDDAVTRAGLGDRDRFVVKIDVEGQELAALAGASRLRADKDHVFVFEDWASTSFETSAALLRDGYPLFYVRTDGRCCAVPNRDAIAAIAAADGPLSRPCNFVAAKRGGAFHARLEDWASR